MGITNVGIFPVFFMANNNTIFSVISKAHFFRKLAVILLVFSFVLGPVLPALAQEVQTTPEVLTPIVEEPVKDIPQTEPPVEDPKDQAPVEIPELPEKVDGEKPDTLDSQNNKEKDPNVDPLAASFSIDSLPNSPREVFSSNRNRISSQIDSLTGALIYKYKILVPPGRNSMTPDVSLVYNSAEASTDSIVGSGWSFDIPYIQRINKTGSQNLYSTDYYTSSLSGELVSTGTNTYAPKSESGDFLTYTKNTNGWTVKDKSGTTYTFGLNAAGRQDNSADTTKIYKWMLEEVRDTNNNYITYEYYQDAGQIYPSKITYTGNNTTAGVMTVNFDREARTNPPTLNYTSFPVTSNYRISEIRTEVSTTWAHKYALTYTTSDNGMTSLLNTIVESGQDDSSTVTTLPAIDFDYQTSTTGWTYNSDFNLPLAIFAGNDLGVRVGDVNGDGLPDLVAQNDGVYLNKNPGWVKSTPWGIPPENFVDSQGQDTGLRLVDLNGDGLADLARANGSVNNVYINNGSGWSLDANWSLPIPFLYSGTTDYGMRMGDINGDGLPDIVCHSDITTGSGPCKQNQPQIYFNNGAGWTLATTSYATPPIRQDDGTKYESFVNGSSQDQGLRLMDINGDGLADLVRGQDTNKFVYINTGTGWTYSTSWGITLPFISSGKDFGMRVNDLNGEGLPDIICRGDFANGSCSAANGTLNYMNDGYNYFSTGSWDTPPRQDVPSQSESFVNSTYGDRGVRLIDVNGDGLPDLVRADSNDKYTYINNTSRPVNYLKKITYPEGGDTTITYKPSAQYVDGSNNLLNPNLPFINTVVSQISDNDGVTSVVHDYTYEGGSYYFSSNLDRKFAGFSNITDTDSAGNVKKTYYHQGNTTNTSLGEYDDHVSKIGKPFRVEEYNNSGNLYRLTVNKWDKYNIGTNHDFVKLVRTTTLNYDGDSDHADTTVEYAYDNTYGNLTTKTDWGKVTGSTDGSFTDTGSDK